MIAGYEAEWRQVIAKAGDCRFSFTMKDPGLAAELDRKTCYTQELTIGISAENAVRDLDALTLPDSLEPLVGETKTVLDAISGTDLESVCGPPLSEVNGSAACDFALGDRFTAYNSLKTVLDRWGPYL